MRRLQPGLSVPSGPMIRSCSSWHKASLFPGVQLSIKVAAHNTPKPLDAVRKMGKALGKDKKNNISGGLLAKLCSVGWFQGRTAPGARR